MSLVSILLPVRDGERFLAAAIKSIVQQRFADFELVVVADGVREATMRIIQEHDDPRIVLLRNETPAGLAMSLNRAIAAARGRFVARMDADDVAMPERLERQVTYLEQHAEVGVLGTACRQIDESDSVLRTVVMPASDLAIRWRAFTGNPFLHPSVMLRRSALDRSGLRYDASLSTAQDYDFWVRLLRHTRGANLDEPLLSIRIHPGSISATMAATQAQAHTRIALREIADIWPDHPFDTESFERLRCLLTKTRPLVGIADKERSPILAAYAELLERFGARHAAHADWPALRRNESVATTFLMLLPPWRRGSLAVVRRLADIEPNLSAAFVSWAFNAAARRFARPWALREQR